MVKNLANTHICSVSWMFIGKIEPIITNRETKIGENTYIYKVLAQFSGPGRMTRAS